MQSRHQRKIKVWCFKIVTRTWKMKTRRRDWLLNNKKEKVGGNDARKSERILKVGRRGLLVNEQDGAIQVLDIKRFIALTGASKSIPHFVDDLLHLRITWYPGCNTVQLAFKTLTYKAQIERTNPLGIARIHRSEWQVSRQWGSRERIVYWKLETGKGLGRSYTWSCPLWSLFWSSIEVWEGLLMGCEFVWSFGIGKVRRFNWRDCDDDHIAGIARGAARADVLARNPLGAFRMLSTV